MFDTAAKRLTKLLRGYPWKSPIFCKSSDQEAYNFITIFDKVPEILKNLKNVKISETTTRRRKLDVLFCPSPDCWDFSLF